MFTVSVSVVAAVAAGAVAIGLQAHWVRARTPRLPVAAGAQSGLVGRAGAQPDRGVRLLVTGESSAIGVGVTAQSHGLAAQLAAILSESFGTVQWRARGSSGATALDTNRRLAADVQSTPADIVIIMLGVNDTLRLSTPFHWYRELGELQEALRRRTGCQLVVIAPIPPLWKFACLPQPLRAFLGLHAFILDRAARLLVHRSRGNLLYVPIPLGDQRELLARDRFHPSRAGYADLARHFAAAIVPAWQRRMPGVRVKAARSPVVFSGRSR